MGIRIVCVCDRCQKEMEEDENSREWRIISQAWLDHGKVPGEEVVLCPTCLKEMGLYDLFYPKKEGEDEDTRETH